MRTIIIDDEKHMRQTIRKMLEAYCPEVKVLAEADGVASGVEVINANKPDLVLLDIKLEDGTGFDILGKLKPVDFKVIFITAWDKYAIQAFRFSALDYLLKPVDPDELREAISKASQVMHEDFNAQLDNLKEHLHSQDKSEKKIILRNADSIFLVSISQIIYCQSDGNYTRIHCSGCNEILVSATLKDYEEILTGYGFFRLHKSYLVNMKYITRFDKAEGGSVIMEGNISIPVSSRKRELLLEMFNRLAES
jgi:two-component system LytT family response regulator